VNNGKDVSRAALCLSLSNSFALRRLCLTTLNRISCEILRVILLSAFDTLPEILEPPIIVLINVTRDLGTDVFWLPSFYFGFPLHKVEVSIEKN
jgi:hypothetical protein